jgi:hypothetical protein
VAAKKGRVPPQLRPFQKGAGAAAGSKTAKSGAMPPKTMSGYPAGTTKGAGIGASVRKGAPAASAAAAATPGARGRRGGGAPAPAASAAAAGGMKQGFGIKSGSSKPSRGGRGKEAAANAGTAPNKSGRVLASPVHHSFAASTIPRADGMPSSPTQKRKMAAPSDNDADDAPPGKRQTGASAYETADDLKKPGAPNTLKAAAPTVSREMAAPHMGFKAAAANAAKSAGVSAQAGAAMVAAASQHASSGAKKANPNLAKVAKKGTTKGPGGKFS